MTSFRDCFIVLNSANWMSCHCLLQLSTNSHQIFFLNIVHNMGGSETHPKANLPFCIGTFRLAPSNDDLTCDGMSSGPSALCLYSWVGLLSDVFSGAIRSNESLRSNLLSSRGGQYLRRDLRACCKGRNYLDPSFH